MRVTPIIHGAGTGLCLVASFLAPNALVGGVWSVIFAAMLIDGARALARERQA